MDSLFHALQLQLCGQGGGLSGKASFLVVGPSESVLTESDDFADEEDGQGGKDNGDPCLKVEVNDVEHGTSVFYDKELADENEADNQEEPFASTEAEGTEAREERPSVEEVPELEHDKGGEENALVVRGDVSVALYVPQQGGHEQEKDAADHRDEVPHGA